MTTPDELLKMAERLEAVNWECHGAHQQHGDDDTPHEAAALLRKLAGEMSEARSREAKRQLIHLPD